VFTILEVLTQSSNGLTLRELADVCGVPKSSVHCIIVTLQRAGYLHRNGRTSRYLFGRKLLRLANQSISGMELRERAEPHMRALARATRLPIHLGIAEFDEAVIVGKVGYAMQVTLSGGWIGKRMELHCTGIGKALLWDWSDAELIRLARERSFSRHNDNTISTLRRLQEDLANSRRLGYSLDDEEDVLGFRCVGVPIRDESGRIIAAMSVAGTVNEIHSENIERIAANLRRTATFMEVPETEAV
jgi:DNA-binding IclR family transcriptional regulator